MVCQSDQCAAEHCAPRHHSIALASTAAAAAAGNLTDPGAKQVELLFLATTVSTQRLNKNNCQYIMIIQDFHIFTQSQVNPFKALFGCVK